VADRLAGRPGSPLADYRAIAGMWIRAALAYPTSFWMMSVGGALTSGLDFVGLWLMFHTIDALGGFTLTEIGLLYGATGVGIGVADLLIGSVERIGAHVRTGSLDAMMVRPVPLLVQVCADQFQPRRFSRIVQALVVLGWAGWFVDWTPARVLVALMMLACSSVIFFCLFVSFSCIQFWTSDSTELANAFTYGGNTITQYPLTVFPRELVKSLTFVLPLAFVNWYPCLYLLGRPDPFGLPQWLQLASPVPAALLCVVTALVWRAGVRHYTSTGS
jgi:ABC-2 type transport system permease protein